MPSSLPSYTAITQGDPAGIGPEIIAMLYKDREPLLSQALVVGSPAVMARALQCVGAQNISIRVIEEGAPLPQSSAPSCMLVKPVGLLNGSEYLPQFGIVSSEAGQMAAEAVVWAADAALNRQVASVVTAPLHKEALHAAGFHFPGHTELLQARAAAHVGVPLAQMPVRMMLANRELRTVLVSIHVSLRQALECVTFENILETLRITHRSELALSGQVPHMAVAGLNPHAGEGGLMGREEIDIIFPAIEQARREGMNVSGPYPPDTVFMRARAKNDQKGDFDVVVCMYHDQGLIPVKYLGVELGVNVTLGLPLIRTSPDHGTAFDLAGTGRANPSSLREALWVARQFTP